MKKILWLALLLPMVAQSNDACNVYPDPASTEYLCCMHPTDPLCPQPTLEDRVGDLENRVTALEALHHGGGSGGGYDPAIHGERIDPFSHLIPMVCRTPTGWGIFENLEWYPNGLSFYDFAGEQPGQHHLVSDINWTYVAVEPYNVIKLYADMNDGSTVTIHDAFPNPWEADQCRWELVYNGLLR